LLVSTRGPIGAGQRSALAPKALDPSAFGPYHQDRRGRLGHRHRPAHLKWDRATHAGIAAMVAEELDGGLEQGQGADGAGKYRDLRGYPGGCRRPLALLRRSHDFMESICRQAACSGAGAMLVGAAAAKWNVSARLDPQSQMVSSCTAAIAIASAASSANS